MTAGTRADRVRDKRLKVRVALEHPLPRQAADALVLGVGERLSCPRECCGEGERRREHDHSPRSPGVASSSAPFYLWLGRLPIPRRDHDASGARVPRSTTVGFRSPPCARRSRRANQRRGRLRGVGESKSPPDDERTDDAPAGGGSADEVLEEARHPPRALSRRGRLLKLLEGRFTVLFFALVVLLLVSPHARYESIGSWIVKLSFIFLMIGTTSSLRGKKHLVLGFALAAIFYVATSLVGLLSQSWGIQLLEQSSAVIFCLAAIVAISLDVFDQRKPVTQDTILGAVSIYLLIAVVFALLYRILEMFDPNALYYAHPYGNRELADFDTLYFSFVTLTTLGYGDITPVTPYARTLAMLESVLGILYLATLVSRLVAAHRARLLNDDKT